MKIIFYNIAYGTGVDGSWKQYLRDTWRFFWTPRGPFRNIGETLQRAKADVICLAEVDGGSFRNRFRCQAKALSKKLKLPFFKTNIKYHPRSIWQWMSMVRKHHDAILANRKGEIRRHHLKSGMKKLVQEFIVDGISIFTVHLAVLSKKVRRKQLSELAEIIKDCPRPHIVCGDFNINTGLEELKEFIQKTKMKRVTKSPSFPSIDPKWYLDLFLTSPDVNIMETGVIPVKYSDHLPIWITLGKQNV